jgi:ketosteroid isomerase-like protein
MSLYPASGPVVSASGGQVSTSRDTLAAGVRAFWDNVGRNMRGPDWQWGAMHVDVLAPDAAVVTTTYRVPHRTPAGEAHVIAGAWTAVFQRRGGRWVIVQEHLSDVPAMTMPQAP